MVNRSNDFSNPIPINEGGTNATTAAGARANLGITIGNRNIVGTTDEIDVANGDGIAGNPTISISPNFLFNFTQAIFVAKGGDDANPGTKMNFPKLTIQAAIDAISDGGLVWVLDAGQYSENLTIAKGLQLWAPNAELDGAGTGDLITVSGGGSVVVRLNIGDINQGGSGLGLNIPDSGTVVFLNAAIFFGSIDSHGSLIISDVAQISSDIHIFSTGLFAADITNDIASTMTFDPGSTIVGTIQQINGPGDTTNTVFGGQTFNDLVQISGAFVVTSLDTTITHTALSASGHVPVIVAAATTAQYKLNGITLNGFGTNFSGGGGDRDLDITDGTNVYTTIPAATLQALINTKWGSADVPYPASIPLNQFTVAGANLYCIYSSGTADYASGSTVITLVYERIV